MSHRLIIFIFLLVVFYVNYSACRTDRAHPNERQKNILHQTFKNLLKIDENQSLQRRSVTTKSERAASKYMRKLFENYRLNQPNFDDDGRALTESDFTPKSNIRNNRAIVRALTPKMGRIDSRDVLAFDLHAVDPKERLLKAEIHYYGGGGRRDDAKKRTLRCFVFTDDDFYAREELRAVKAENPIDKIEDDDVQKWRVFDALKMVNASTSSDSDNPRNSSIIFVGFAKNNGRFVSARKILRFHSPFLSIFTRDDVRLETVVEEEQKDEENDSEENEDENDEQEQGEMEEKENANFRRKRNVDAYETNGKYYEYYHQPQPQQKGLVSSTTSSSNDVITDPLESSVIQRGPSVLRRGGGNQGNSKTARRAPKKTSRRNGRRNQRQEFLTGSYVAPVQDETNRRRNGKYGKVLKAHDANGRQSASVILLQGAGGRNDDKRTAVNTCQRNDLVVDFNDIGWGDYIIAPSSFEAHYCDGACPSPMPASVNATNHAIILDIIQKIRLHPRVPKACCAPEKMDSLSLLYYDADGSIVLTTFPKMTVVSCACL